MIKMEIEALRNVCQYFSISRDMYRGGKYEDACHVKENPTFEGSWGKCNEDVCPLAIEKCEVE